MAQTLIAHRGLLARERTGAAAHGFTLLELVTVMGVLAILFGIGIGMLQRGETDRSEAMTALRGELRSAALAARQRGLPTEVLLVPATEEAPAFVRSRQLEPVGTWHLEPGERQANPAMVPVLAGADVETGRFGHGRRSLPGENAPLFRLAASGSLWDLSAGFALRIDLLLDRGGEAVVARLGDSLELALGADRRPRVRMVQRGVTGRRGVTAVVTGGRYLPVGSWCTVEVLHDGEALSLRIDGLEIGRESAPNPLYQQNDDVLEVSPGDAPVPGVVDEIQLWAFQWSSPQPLPLAVEVREPRRIVFDERGKVVGAGDFSLQFADDEPPVRFTVTAGGILR